MKKLICFIIFIIFQSNISLSKDFFIGDKVSDILEVNKRLKIPLSKGEWEVVEYRQVNWGSLTQRVLSLIRVEKNIVVEAFEVYEGFMGVKFAGQIDAIVREIMFQDEHDGCYERPEYYILEIYEKGTTHNCFLIQTLDTQKELFNPDDGDTSGTAGYRQFLKKNPSIIFSKIMFSSVHSYYSRLVGGNWYRIRYLADPEIYNSPKITKFTEETSEFHKYNISNYPEHKKTMDLWLSISAKRHIEFEKMSRTKKRHLLDLISYEPIEYENKQIKKDSNDDDLLNDLNELIELYNSGILTKEEFEKAKKKILN